MPNTNNVTTGKATLTGPVHRAPVGTTLPTDATTALASAFINLGYVGEDGLVNSNTRTVEQVKAWGGDVIANLQTDQKDSFKFKFVESVNAEVLKSVYGESNVTVSSTQISVSVKNTEPTCYVWVFDMILQSGKLKRIVVPNASITSVGDISYVDNELISYEVELTALADANSITHYEYIEV